MEVDGKLNLTALIAPSAVTHSVKLSGKTANQCYLAYSVGHVVYIAPFTSPRNRLSEILLPGSVICLRALADGLKWFVIYSSYGEERLSIYENGLDPKEVFTSSSSFPGCLGERISVPILSNMVDGLQVLQIYQTSLHVVLETNVSVFTLPGVFSKITSLILQKHSSNSWVLYVVSGEGPLRMFQICLDVSSETLNIEKVVKLPKHMLGIDAYFGLAVDSSLLFIGGDGASFSSLCIVTNDRQKSLIHGPPMPCPAVVGTGVEEFLVATSLGDLYNVSSHGCDLVYSKLPLSPVGASTMTLHKTCLFIGQTMGDSCVYYLDDASKRIVSSFVLVSGLAPVLAISPTTKKDNVITCVSGYGKSAAINRIITSGIGCVDVPLERFCVSAKMFTMGLFHLVFSNAIESRLCTHNKGQLSEVNAAFPAGILNIHQYTQNEFIAVCEFGVYLVANLQPNQIWSCPHGSFVSGSSFSDGVCAIAVGMCVYQLLRVGKEWTVSLRKQFDCEITTLAIYRDFLAVGLWNETFEISSESNGLRVVSSGLVGCLWLGLMPESFGNVSVSLSGLMCAVAHSDGRGEILWGGQFENVFLCGSSLAADFSECCIGGKRVLVVSGQRPGIVNTNSEGNLAISPIVCGGKLDLMRNIVVCENGLVWYLGLEFELHCGWINPRRVALDESHVQRLFISGGTLPVGIEHVGENFYVGVSGGEIDCVQIFRQDLSGRGDGEIYFKLPLNEKLSSMCSDGEVICVGSSLGRVFGGPSMSPLITLKGPVMGVSTGLGAPFVAAIAERTLYILSHDMATIVASIETDFFATTIDTNAQGQILVGDIARSVALFRFKDSTLRRVGSDSRSVGCVSSAIVQQTNNSFLMGDEFGNLTLFEGEELCVAERFNIGESAITCITANSENCWIGTRDGSICSSKHGNVNKRVRIRHT